MAASSYGSSVRSEQDEDSLYEQLSIGSVSLEDTTSNGYDTCVIKSVPPPPVPWRRESNQSWQHLAAGRRLAEELLKTYGDDGAFLVRLKETNKKEYVLSVRFGQEVIHAPIDREGSFFTLPGYPKFSSLSDLIDYLMYQDNQLTIDGKWIEIRQPISSAAVANRREGTDQVPNSTTSPVFENSRARNEEPSYASIHGSHKDPYATIQNEQHWAPEASGVMLTASSLPLYQELEAERGGSVIETAPSSLSSEALNVFVGRVKQNWLHSATDAVKQRAKAEGKSMELQERLLEILRVEAIFLETVSIIAKTHMEWLDPMKENRCGLKKQEFYTLFSNILAVRKVSSRLMVMLEKEWKKSPILEPKSICRYLSEYASRYYNVYVTYVGNMKFQQQEFARLKKANKKFLAVTKDLEKHYKAKNKDLMSFLATPFHHITRAPLLVEALEKYMGMEDDGFEEVQICKETLTEIVAKCQAKVREFGDYEYLTGLNRSIIFGEHKRMTIVTTARFLVREGELAYHSSATQSKGELLTLVLFNDLLLLTSKKGNKYQLLDQSEKQGIYTKSIKLETKSKGSVSVRFFFELVFLGKQRRSYMLSCKSRDERLNWLRSLHPNTIHKRDEPDRVDSCPKDTYVYKHLQRPQVIVLKAYNAKADDEMTLAVNDVLRVNKENNSGYMKGERLRDGQRGWFPSDRVERVAQSKTHIVNLREQIRVFQQTVDIMEDEMNLQGWTPQAEQPFSTVSDQAMMT